MLPWASGSSPASQVGGNTRHYGEPLAGWHPAGQTSYRSSLRCLLSSERQPGQGLLWGSPGAWSTHVPASLTHAPDTEQSHEDRTQQSCVLPFGGLTLGHARPHGGRLARGWCPSRGPQSLCLRFW